MVRGKNKGFLFVVRNMKKSFVTLWLFTALLIGLNWTWTSNLTVKVFSSAFLLCVAAVFTYRTLRPSAADAESGGHINTRMLRQKYGAWSFLRTYWSLMFLVIATALAAALPDSVPLDRMKWLALVLFFVDGLYLCAVIFREKHRM